MRFPGVCICQRQADWGKKVNIYGRPGQAEREPGPIPRGPAILRRGWLLLTNLSLWLWVPAFAGTTSREKFCETYTDAVVTPPSTTMVCPVMKLEASEPR